MMNQQKKIAKEVMLKNKDKIYGAWIMYTFPELLEGELNAIINYMLGKPITGTFNFNLGDLDENGIIDISDINSVINLMLGKY